MKSVIFWCKIGLLNFAIVAAIGVLMRYKICFEFPYFNQKYLMHSHSHFAFAAWVTHVLFVLMVDYLKGVKATIIETKKYDKWIVLNLVFAYGMLISFAVQGYGFVSIFLSTGSIFINYFFAAQYFKDLKSIKASAPSKNWFKAALLFNILSSLGTFYLAYMMATKTIEQHAYLASIYFYLHFQYSGWFFFACMGLLFSKLEKLEGFTYNKKIFSFFFIACIPAYLLSVLWANLPWFIYAIAVLAVFLQLFGLYDFIKLLKENLKQIKQKWIKPTIWIMALVLGSLVIKLFLQAGTLFPSISKLAFGFRPIVIAYLHLVLLALTSLFLIGYMVMSNHIKINTFSIVALITICIGVFLNEFILMVQGVASFGYIIIPYINHALLGVSILILIGVSLLMISFKSKMGEN